MENIHYGIYLPSYLHLYFFLSAYEEISFLYVHNTKYCPNLSKPMQCFKCNYWFLLQDLSVYGSALQTAWATSFFLKGWCALDQTK